MCNTMEHFSDQHMNSDDDDDDFYLIKKFKYYYHVKMWVTFKS